MTLTGTILPALMVVLGLAMVVRAVSGGAGPIAYGVLIGLLFVVAGAGRLWVGRRPR